MLNRLTISALLKSVIALMAACVVAFLVMTAWESWGRLQTAARISVIADASAHAFKAMKLHRVEANIQPRNVRSRALVKKLGFHREGVSPRYLKINGRWRDHERWAILAEDW